ncbi:MAG: DUF4348 domain-containing protein [Prevotella sp.]|nr:DUF4348 domain-containing protein [Prevotella sp.]
MRRWVLTSALMPVMVLMLLLLTGCSRSATVAAGQEQSEEREDSAQVSAEEELLEAEVPMPKAADELFDDFFFNFVTNHRLQRQRIKFPLQVSTDDGEESKAITRKEWQSGNFLAFQEFYTLVLDNPEQAEMAKDSALVKVVVEKIELDEGRVEQYLFDRIADQWYLTSIHRQALNHNRNASFWEFYQQFSTDSLFQKESLNDHVRFTTTDPDDDFQIISGTMEPEQWEAFRPVIIPSGTVYNVVYGDSGEGETEKVFGIHGMANEIESEFVFRKRNGEWRLTSFSE